MKLDIVTEGGEKYVVVTRKAEVDEILRRVVGGIRFAYRFKFAKRRLLISLLEQLEIRYEDFTTKYHHFDAGRKLHISESEFGYVWISTSGLVADNKPTQNSAVNACLTQSTVISLLMEKAIEVIRDERVYDIQSYHFGLLSKLSPAIFHHMVFYIEVFCKAYLSLSGIPAPKIHRLAVLYQLTVDTMKANKHDDSLFQVLVLDPIYQSVAHLDQLPGDFKEHAIKYDANPGDDTTILFDMARLTEMQHLLELSVDFIADYYYEGSASHYLHSDLFQRMLDRAETEDEKKRVKALYPHLDKSGSTVNGQP